MTRFHSIASRRNRAFLANNPDTYGMTLTLEPRLAPGGKPYSPYHYGQQGTLNYADVADEHYR